MQSSSRLARPPERAYTKFGFGLGAVPHHAWGPRRDAVQRVRDIFDRSLPAVWSYENFHALGAVREMFQKIRCENAFDWFTICRLFGMPSGKLAGKIQKTLRDATEALRQGSAKELDGILDRLDRDAFGDMLDAYLTATHPASPQFLDEPYGWVGLVWSSSRSDEVLIRSTAGRAHALTPNAAGQDPSGLLAAWNVSDAHLAREELAELFHDSLELEPVRLRRHGSHLLEIKQEVEALLFRENLLALSPWHEIKVRRRERPNFLEAAIESDPPSRAFADDVSEIFSAFNKP
ncbi:hypothetical protein GOB27_19445 [Sinorhizobium meliloti]|nr:hypothetical protein [Sinorhizobium meliloti]